MAVLNAVFRVSASGRSIQLALILIFPSGQPECGNASVRSGATRSEHLPVLFQKRPNSSAGGSYGRPQTANYMSTLKIIGFKNFNLKFSSLTLRASISIAAQSDLPSDRLSRIANVFLKECRTAGNSSECVNLHCKFTGRSDRSVWGFLRFSNWGISSAGEEFGSTLNSKLRKNTFKVLEHGDHLRWSPIHRFSRKQTPEWKTFPKMRQIVPQLF